MQIEAKKETKNIFHSFILRFIFYSISIAIIITLLNMIQGFLPLSAKDKVEVMMSKTNRYQRILKETGSNGVEKDNFIKNLPDDIFSLNGSKLKIDSTKNNIYSIGPDGIDDLGEIIYDPTNGIKSRGDILGSY